MPLSSSVMAARRFASKSAFADSSMPSLVSSFLSNFFPWRMKNQHSWAVLEAGEGDRIWSTSNPRIEVLQHRSSTNGFVREATINAFWDHSHQGDLARTLSEMMVFLALWGQISWGKGHHHHLGNLHLHSTCHWPFDWKPIFRTFPVWVFLSAFCLGSPPTREKQCYGPPHCE